MKWSCSIDLLLQSSVVYTVFRKNTHSHFLSYLHEICVDLNINYSEYTQGKVDSGNVKIRYSLWQMTTLWRHICLAKVGGSLQHAISHEPRISYFCEYMVGPTCWCTDAVVSCIIWWNLRQFNIKQLFFIHQIKFDHLLCEKMLQQLNVVGDSCKSTFVLNRKADILSISYDISIQQWLSNILVDIC